MFATCLLWHSCPSFDCHHWMLIGSYLPYLIYWHWQESLWRKNPCLCISFSKCSRHCHQKFSIGLLFHGSSRLFEQLVGHHHYKIQSCVQQKNHLFLQNKNLVENLMISVSKCRIVPWQAIFLGLRLVSHFRTTTVLELL